MPSDQDNASEIAKMHLIWRVIIMFVIAAVCLLILGFLVVSITVYFTHNGHDIPLQHKSKIEDLRSK